MNRTTGIRRSIPESSQSVRAAGRRWPAAVPLLFVMALTGLVPVMPVGTRAGDGSDSTDPTRRGTVSGPARGHVRVADGLLPLPSPGAPRFLPQSDTSAPESAGRFLEIPDTGANGVVSPAQVTFESGYSDADDEPLPPLEEELWLHGGSHLYEAEGDQFDQFLNGGGDLGHGHHFRVLRLPEGWQRPEPLTAFQQFEGNDEIGAWSGLQWPGDEGFQWEPRFVGYGSYEVFGMFLEQGGTRQDGIGHQLVVDLDLRITGTERAHVQFRPLGERNTGGSIYRLDDPTHYEDNSTGIPDRWWVEGEFYSLFGGLIDDQFTPLDYHVTAGKVPYSLHNALLVNDEMTGVILTKNTLIIPPLSNLLIQGFYFFDDVDARTPRSADLVGVHAQADWRHLFLEATFAYVSHSASSAYDSRYAAVSATKFFGPLSLAGRGFWKGGDDAGIGDGALFVLESNLSRVMSDDVTCWTGIESAVLYANAFHADSGWNPIAGANYNRLRSTFAVNPLVRIGQGFDPAETVGATLGVQLFRHDEDESFTPEFAWEELRGEAVWGAGLRWQRKLSPRVYLDVNGLKTWSDDQSLDREGVFVSTFVVF